MTIAEEKCRIIFSPSSTPNQVLSAVQSIRNASFCSSPDAFERASAVTREAVSLGITKKIVQVLTGPEPDEDALVQDIAILVANMTVLHVSTTTMIEQGALEALAVRISHDNVVGLLCLMSVANLVGREEGERGKMLSANSKLAKRLMEVLEETLEGRMVYQMWWTVEEILNPLSSMVVSDDNKPHFCNEETTDLLLRVVNNDESSTEAIGLALISLLQLCFEPTGTVKKLLRDPSRSVVQRLDHINASDIMNALVPEAKESVGRLKWTIVEPPAAAAAVAPTPRASVASNKKRIFMSYNWKHQPIIKKVVQIVKDAGFDVWFDLEQMHGSTMEAMADGIDSSDLVLMTISPEYKDSANCRLEGQYAAQQKLPIIPLMMQKGYAPKGWLGLLLGTQLWYDLTSEDKITATMPAVIAAINGTLLGKFTAPPPVSQPDSSTDTKDTHPHQQQQHHVAPVLCNPTMEAMTADKLEEWLKKGSLETYNPNLQTNKIDGKALGELNRFLQRGSIADVEKVQQLLAFDSLGDTLRFTSLLGEDFGRR